MAKIKFICPRCGRALQYDDSTEAEKIKCRHCKVILDTPALRPSTMPLKSGRSRRKTAWLVAIFAALLTLAVSIISLAYPPLIHWSDRRPIGVLFLASNYHSSPANPRGWFNDPRLDVASTNGAARFRTALMDYADRSIAVLKRIDAQGVIVWNLEGEQFPHKTSYIGDPRLLRRLAPEMDAAADEFFARFRDAGFRVGVTIRPQHLVFDNYGVPRQHDSFNLKQALLQKIDFARRRWGASLFYIDSNGGVRRPDEAWQLHSLAAARPDILLIPEHPGLFYSSFSALYTSLRRHPEGSPSSGHRAAPGPEFRAIDIGDAPNTVPAIVNARAEGDIILFRAWYWNQDCELIEQEFPHKP